MRKIYLLHDFRDYIARRNSMDLRNARRNLVVALKVSCIAGFVLWRNPVNAKSVGRTFVVATSLFSINDSTLEGNPTNV
jgi:hypothetical protein